jgi:hypothetical protein
MEDREWEIFQDVPERQDSVGDTLRVVVGENADLGASIPRHSGDHLRCVFTAGNG